MWSAIFENSWPLFGQIWLIFNHLEVVDRVSETQLQVGENSDWIIWRLKGELVLVYGVACRFCQYYMFLEPQNISGYLGTLCECRSKDWKKCIVIIIFVF